MINNYNDNNKIDVITRLTTNLRFEISFNQVNFVPRSYCQIAKIYGQDKDNCKTINLVIYTLGWLTEMLSVNRKSHVICHVLTLRIFDASKKLRFWQNLKKILNWLNLANWAGLHKNHVRRSQDEVMCKNHELKLRAGVTGWGHVQGACKLPGIICIYEWVEFSNSDSLRVKRRYQLVIRLKTNKCYQELLYYLSSYINLLNIRLCVWL